MTREVELMGESTWVAEESWRMTVYSIMIPMPFCPSMLFLNIRLGDEFRCRLMTGSDQNLDQDCSDP